MNCLLDVSSFQSHCSVGDSAVILSVAVCRSQCETAGWDVSDYDDVGAVAVVDRFGRYGNSCSAGAGECGYVDTGIVAGISVRYSFLHAPQYIFVVWLMGIVEVG